MSTTNIPRISYDDGVRPGWISASSEGKPAKPIIRCQCGKYTGISLHHVHADGTVTASFHHAAAHELQKIGDKYFFTHRGKQYQTDPGCGWHVWLKLMDYNKGEFLPEE